MLGRTFGTHRFSLSAVALGAVAVLAGCQQANPDTQAAGASELTSATSVQGWVTDCSLTYQSASTGIIVATLHNESTSGDFPGFSGTVGDLATLPFTGYADLSGTGGDTGMVTSFIRDPSHLVAETDVSLQLGGGGTSWWLHPHVEPFEYQGQTYITVDLLCNVTPKTVPNP